MRRSRVARTGESDLIRVETNVAFPQVEGDMASWACHNLAEAIALELAVGDDYLDTKSRLWAIIADQSGVATALRRSAKARITAVDADCALEGEPASPR